MACIGTPVESLENYMHMHGGDNVCSGTCAAESAVDVTQGGGSYGAYHVPVHKIGNSRKPMGTLLSATRARSWTQIRRYGTVAQRRRRL